MSTINQQSAQIEESVRQLLCKAPEKMPDVCLMKECKNLSKDGSFFCIQHDCKLVAERRDKLSNAPEFLQAYEDYTYTYAVYLMEDFDLAKDWLCRKWEEQQKEGGGCDYFINKIKRTEKTAEKIYTLDMHDISSYKNKGILNDLQMECPDFTEAAKLQILMYLTSKSKTLSIKSE